MRKNSSRSCKNEVLILTNGKTEEIYFNSLKNIYSSIYKISIRFNNSDCKSLVELAIKNKNKLYNQIWVVFDVDDSIQEGNYVKACELAKKKRILNLHGQTSPLKYGFCSILKKWSVKH